MTTAQATRIVEILDKLHADEISAARLVFEIRDDVANGAYPAACRRLAFLDELILLNLKGQTEKD